ncbi:MAG: hypothetical protein ACYDEB_08895 [Dehalococcoidia bacterium]
MRRSPAMARAVRRGEWERLALYLALAVAQAARAAPQATIDDVLALLGAAEEERGDARPS